MGLVYDQVLILRQQTVPHSHVGQKKGMVDHHQVSRGGPAAGTIEEALSPLLVPAALPEAGLGLRLHALPGLEVLPDQDDLRAIRAWEALRSDRMISASEAQMMYNYLHGGRDIARGHKTLPDDIPLEMNWDFLSDVCGLDPKNELKSMPWFDVFSNTRLHDNKRDHYRAILRHGYTFTGKPKFNCSTIHGVKGGEADNVIVIDAMARRTYKDFEEVNPDAEHRVQYVGATRAKQNLFILKTGEPQHYPF